jgi:dynein heavy chain
MLVGDSFSGKTTCYKILADAINELRTYKESYANTKVETYIINPKSVTIEELYGFTDASLNWTDGILSQMMRNLVQNPSPSLKWIILG